MNKEKLRKIYIVVLAVYVALVTSFYFLAGDQLWYKEAKEATQMYAADAITEEINEDTKLIQNVKCTTDRLESLEFVFTKNYQEGSGKLTIVVWSDNKVLSRLAMDVKDVPEQHRVYLELDEPVDKIPFVE